MSAAPRGGTVGGTIVCDVTDPSAGHAAAEFAGALGARLHLRLVLVCVAAPDSVAETTRRNGAERTLLAIAREIGPDAETRVAVGDHVEALARVAAEEGADLIVVGARPSGLGGRNLRWTIARELEAATPVPVLVAPPSTRKRSDRRLAVVADTDPQ
jgi:nucleotide-binding universal stress UspA family protein